MFDRLYFDILLSKSTVGHHAKGRAMCVLSNETKFGQTKECLGHL